MKNIEMFERSALAYMIGAFQKYPNLAMNIEPSSAWVVGVTGVTGAGKSMLISRLIPSFRKKDMRVVALLIDPSSQKRGWAILGDRRNLRSDELDCDKGLFIRSLATRGEWSALTDSLSKIIAYSKLFSDIVIVETAGAGQTDVEIREHVDTLVQVIEPLGDSLNLEKAGQSEEVNIFVVNDREDFKSGKKFFTSAKLILGEQYLDDGWRKKVYLANAETGFGVAEVVEGLFEHRDFLETKKV
ncbi:MAG: Membrane ATPase/protein kinase [Candidatus Giovannonibacteria bacterium GW2011_GWA2_44_13b]|uniref:Membrane ATPase/protein kinase n=2 Tax=Candidatus Giovannoniibacteriota TaxID=1752738 RepID=A0A0G1JDP1_9BACT|nr:MAG: Membrane ATPase/protein kinase [Candidatus Giovannonibacteria bacterium GW2011_GWA2_44_13b]OGF81570.1 MAG: hypothetical protein A2924_02375 [Candidatus Giovannonibacteria bacterium RIFCSPLOWO2_01_FULL_44_16]